MRTTTPRADVVDTASGRADYWWGRVHRENDMRLRRPFTIVASAALALSLGLSTPAFAQTTQEADVAACLEPGQSLAGFTIVNGIPQTSDGVTYYDASQATQAQFIAAFGDCAPIQWAIQHQQEIARNPAVVDAPVPALSVQDFRTPAPAALDGQTLADQPLSVQQDFITAWGPAAAEMWVDEHNSTLIRAGVPVPLEDQEAADTAS